MSRPGRLLGRAAGAALAGMLLTACGTDPSPSAQHQPWHADLSAPTAAAKVPTVAQPSATRPGPARSRRSVSSDTVTSAGLLLGLPAHTAVAVEDLSDGRTLVRGAVSHPFVTASIAKVDILAALLLERQNAGASGLSAGQRPVAVRMIEASDNDCADLLFRQAGGAYGLGRANRRFGLTSTKVHDPRWGLTTTTARDQLRLLQQVFTDQSVLDASSRAYLQLLMGQVDADENWGVSAAADGPFALKNGWLPRPDGSWTVNSVGGVRHQGHQLLIVVLSDRNRSESAGITLTQTLAKAAATAITGR